MRVKKKAAYILLILFILLSVFVVYKKFSSDKSQRIYKEAINNLSNIKSYSFSQIVSVSYDNLDEKLKSEVVGKVDEVELKYNYVFDKLEIYGNVINNKNYVYSKQDNSWVSMKSDNKFFSVRKLGLFLSEKKNIREVSSEIRSLSKFRIKSNYKLLKKYVFPEILNIINQLDIIDNSSNLIIYVYVDEDKNIRKISFDLKDYLKNSKSPENKVKSVIVDLNIDDINNVSQIFPEDLSNLDVNYDKINAVGDSYTEEQIMYDIILSATVYCKPDTIDFSRYKKELNDYLQLDEYNLSSITEGIVKVDSDCNVVVKKDFIINGKKCTYNENSYESCK